MTELADRDAQWQCSAFPRSLPPINSASLGAYAHLLRDLGRVPAFKAYARVAACRGIPTDLSGIAYITREAAYP